jgi:hypothetical protein
MPPVNKFGMTTIACLSVCLRLPLRIMQTPTLLCRRGDTKTLP